MEADEAEGKKLELVKVEPDPEPELARDEGAPAVPAPRTSGPPPLLLPVDALDPIKSPLPAAASGLLPPAGGAAVDALPLRPSIVHRVEAWGRRYFLNARFSFLHALWPMVAVALVLFTRWPGTNYIFDEQEALLANPYVNATGGLKFVDAIHRDFWGLAPDRSVGSYRPVPNFLWRALWHVSHAPFFHHLYNVALHGVNAALLAWIVWSWTRRRDFAYLSGFVFVTCAVLTEAVSGIVGIADVLGGLGALLALAALSLPAWGMPFCVFAAVLFGLFSKESALVCVPLVPFAAVVAAPLTHPERPARALRGLLALAASAAAFVLYVELRKKWFPSPLPSELTAELPANATALDRGMRALLVWFHQAPLPKDPLNNPLAEADTKHRVAGALRVYFRGLEQMVVPGTLSGDYSFPQEPVPDKLWSVEIVAGGLLMAVPPIAGVGLWISALVRERRARAERRRLVLERGDDDARDSLADEDVAFRGGDHEYVRLGAGAALTVLALAVAGVDWFVLRPRGQAAPWLGLPLVIVAAPVLLLGLGLVAEGLKPVPSPDAPHAPVSLDRAALVLLAIGLVWTVVSFFPHSNIPVVLPTVRAERFWYFPAIGTSLVFAVVFVRANESWRARRVLWMGPLVIGLFLGFHALQAYRHAMDYRSDLDFWAATKEAVPNSAKAHLNYSVMKGARGDLETRLTESKIALALAPKWPMAHVYTGDTLCRMHRPDDAWPYYKSGFDIGPNELSLIALGLQCLYDEKKLKVHEDELRDLAARHEGSWIAYLAIDTLQNGDKNKGVDPKYRPRGYNEGPKEDKDDDEDDDATASASASASGSAGASAGRAGAATAGEPGDADATATATARQNETTIEP
ncbi:MAG TPA: tetratricopeptide repeat protein [Minicystis sp.]|nr:tetratricopeptide repeat protein [Minicystis sp.]